MFLPYNNVQYTNQTRTILLELSNINLFFLKNQKAKVGMLSYESLNRNFSK